ncbi:cytochrome P450 94C1 [Tanacetum coccineum]
MELQASISFIYFTFTAVFFLFSVSLYILRLNRVCNCDVCTAFITRSWTSQFVNLSDWFTHLLSKSPTGTIHVHVVNNVITANPDNVEYMIKTNFENYPKGKAFSAILGDLLGRGEIDTSPLVWKFKRLFNIGSEKKLKSSIRVVKKLADQVIKKRRELGTLSNNDLLSRFMASISDDDYLRDIVISFLLAGRDTVASALTSFFLLLSQNPKVIEKIGEESDRVMGPNRETLPGFGDLQKLLYLQAALHESMRLYPPVHSSLKFITKTIRCLPDGSFVDTRGRSGHVPSVCMGRIGTRFDVRVVEPTHALRFAPGLTASFMAHRLKDVEVDVALAAEEEDEDHTEDG